MVRALLLLFLVGCVPQANSGKPWKVAEIVTPEIASTDLYCDVDAAKWELEVEATAWTGGGSTVWTVDGIYAETHRVNSLAAAADGSEDLLKLSLKIVADWREAKNGSATTFLCAEDPNVVFILKAVDGTVVDCASYGPDPLIWNEVEGVAPCE